MADRKMLRYRITFELLVPADQEDGESEKTGNDFAQAVEEAVTAEIDDALSSGDFGGGDLLVDDAQGFDAKFIGEEES